MDFWKKLEELCSNFGIAPTKLGKVVPNLKITGATVTGWRNGAKPRPDKVKALADYFNVPVSYFLDDDVSVKVSGLQPLTAVDPFEEQLIDIYNNLPAEKKVELMSYAFRLKNGN